ncbi:uncharacterized protein LOC125177801 [Hyalella azteca]|uniref:Uncharacterized protein LOC125177801 n=1 Tax=Hyalella azteca TaxID=294128 RepID=A0A979FHH7_HYAAZ|nr:uncharacterized protein LOC125177801 [Hyalella azteca]
MRHRGAERQRGVHVVHVSAPTSGRVLVMLRGSPPSGGRVALLLHSSLRQGAVFTVTAPQHTALKPPVVLVSGADRVQGAGPHVERHRHAFPTQQLIAAAYTQLGFVTSYTRMRKATRVIIRLDAVSENGNLTQSCDTSVQQTSPVASCYVTRPVPLAGCYHHTNMFHSGVHIIAVDGSQPAVTVEVVGGGGDPHPASPPTRKENLTLVLASPLPSTTWTLTTAGLRGAITVVLGPEDAELVEETKVDAGVEVAVERQRLPSSFDQLLMHVLNNIGPFNWYASSSASRIRLTISPVPELDELVQKWLVVECPPRHMIASLPRWVMDKVTEALGGRLVMAMTDHPECHSKNNGTHLVLDARLNGCGFWKQMRRQKGLFVNEVTMQTVSSVYSDDDELAGSGSGIDEGDDDEDLDQDQRFRVTSLVSVKVDCPAPVALPESTLVSLPTVPRPNVTKGNVTPTPSSVSKLEPVPYVLNVERIPNVVDASRVWVRFRATASAASEIEAWVRLVLEHCWVSGKREPERPQLTLVRKSCSVNTTVTMLPRQYHHSSSFTFGVDEHQQQVFLHCKVGICSTDPDLAKEYNLQQCREPSLYCHKLDVRPIFFSFTPASQLKSLVSGPLPMHEDLAGAMDEDGSAIKSAAAPSSGQQPLTVIQGVATEIVIGISISSFLIGVCLTGVLWLIHVHTDPRRQHRPEPAAPRNSGYDLSANSGSTTPSSQAPMTA